MRRTALVTGLFAVASLPLVTFAAPAPVLAKRGEEAAFKLTESYLVIRLDGQGPAAATVCNRSDGGGRYSVIDVPPDQLPPPVRVRLVEPGKCQTIRGAFEVIVEANAPWSGTVRFD